MENGVSRPEKRTEMSLSVLYIYMYLLCDFSTNDFVCSIFKRARAVLYNLRMNITAHCLAKHVVVAI